jgi:hypothetical protein
VPLGPSEFSGQLLDRSFVRTIAHPLMELAGRLKPSRRSVPLLLVRDPTLLLAVSSASWFSRCSGDLGSSAPNSTSTLSAFLQSLATVDPSRLTGVDRLLSWTSLPYSTSQVQRSTGQAAFHTAFVPPSGFGYPLDGLLPLNPSGNPLDPAALMGFAPSESYLPARCHGVSTLTAPPAVPLAPYAAN